jgi:hypothetical protein
MVQNLNRYSYVLNNPLRYNDPTGHLFEGIGREINRGLKTGGKALRNPGAFLQNTWDKAGRGLSDPRYLRLTASIAISVVATVYCPIGADAAWYQTAAYYAAVGATSSYVASNGDSKAALNGAYAGAAFNMVGTYFEYAKGAGQLSGSSLMAAKIAAHGVVGGLSAQSQGGSFESGFLSAGLSQGVGQYMDANGFGYAADAQGMDIAYNAGVAAIVGGTISSISGGSFEQGALNAAMGRLFNDGAHAGILGTMGIGYGEYGAAVRGFVTTAGEWLAGSDAVAAGRAGAVGIVGWAVFHSDEIGPEAAQPKPAEPKIEGHAEERANERGVSPEAIIDALHNPIKSKPIRTDSLGRPSQQIIGNQATVVVNPETGKIITVWPTSSRMK